MTHSLARAFLGALLCSAAGQALALPAETDAWTRSSASATPIISRPGAYVRPPTGALAPKCAGNQRDGTCLGSNNFDGTRVTDNLAATTQAITNARRIPQKPDLLPLGPILGEDGHSNQPPETPYEPSPGTPYQPSPGSGGSTQ